MISVASLNLAAANAPFCEARMLLVCFPSGPSSDGGSFVVSMTSSVGGSSSLSSGIGSPDAGPWDPGAELEGTAVVL